MDQPDWQQLQLALAHDRSDGVARLYDAAAPMLFRFLRRLTGDDEESADVLQDLFLTLTRSAPLIGQVRDFKAYLFTTARNSVYRRHRKQTPLAAAGAGAAADDPDLNALPAADTVLSREPNAAAGVLAAERNQRIDQALCQLPADQREVVALKIDGGFTFEEIGRQLNIPWPTAASRYRYALAALRQALEDLQHE